MRRFASVLMATVLSITPLALFAHNGKDHKLMGTVLSIDARHLDIKTPNGKKVSVPLAASTMFICGEGIVKVSDVKPGTRVVIDLGENGKAAHVRLPSMKKLR
ncbi:MAG: hypothetical protein ABIP63_08805 [Thermoanaerobaculia bacterium]